MRVIVYVALPVALGLLVHGSLKASGAEESFRELVVTSGRCTGLTKLEAQTTAEKQAERAMAQALQELAGQWGEVRIGAAQALREWTWLLGQPGVRQNVERTAAAKDYGWVAEQKITLQIPYEVLSQWSARLRTRQAMRWRGILAGSIATVVVPILGLGAMVVLDRWTRGYYRGLVVSVVLLAMGVPLAALWTWIVFFW